MNVVWVGRALILSSVLLFPFIIGTDSVACAGPFHAGFLAYMVLFGGGGLVMRAGQGATRRELAKLTAMTGVALVLGSIIVELRGRGCVLPTYTT